MDSRMGTLSCFVLLFMALAINAGSSAAATLSFYNKCRQTVWPGIQPSAGRPVLARGGFQLLPNQAYSLHLPAGWSGRVWGRQGCAFDPATGRGRCATGDCGGVLHCDGLGGVPPATLAEFTLGQGRAQDFYDVSLVDGYNLPMRVVPQGGSGVCGSAGCAADLNGVCPSELKVAAAGEGVACKSACGAFGSPEYCCSGAYANSNTCKPTAYSEFFKKACPKAYSYAFDDATSTFTCASAAGYLITFCPSTTSQKSSGGQINTDSSTTSTGNGEMVYLGGDELSGAAPTGARAAAFAICVSLLASISWPR